MWDLIVSVPDHCLSFYFRDSLRKDGKVLLQRHLWCSDDLKG